MSMQKQLGTGTKSSKLNDFPVPPLTDRKYHQTSPHRLIGSRSSLGGLLKKESGRSSLIRVIAQLETPRGQPREALSARRKSAMVKTQDMKQLTQAASPRSMSKSRTPSKLPISSAIRKSSSNMKSIERRRHDTIEKLGREEQRPNSHRGQSALRRTTPMSRSQIYRDLPPTHPSPLKPSIKPLPLSRTPTRPLKSASNAKVVTPRGKMDSVRGAQGKGKLKLITMKTVTTLLNMMKPHDCVRDALGSLCALIWPELNEKLICPSAVIEWRELKEYCSNLTRLQNSITLFAEKSEIAKLESKFIANSARFAAAFRHHYTTELLVNEQNAVKDIVRFTQSVIKVYGEIKPVEELKRSAQRNSLTPKTSAVAQTANKATLNPAPFNAYDTPREEIRCEPLGVENLPQPEAQERTPAAVNASASPSPYIDSSVGSLRKKYIHPTEEKSEIIPVVIKAYLTNPENSKTDETGRSHGNNSVHTDSPREVSKREQLDFSFEHKRQSNQKDYFIQDGHDAKRDTAEAQNNSLLWTKSSISKQPSSSLLSIEDNNNPFINLLEDGVGGISPVNSGNGERMTKIITKRLGKINNLAQVATQPAPAPAVVQLPNIPKPDNVAKIKKEHMQLLVLDNKGKLTSNPKPQTPTRSSIQPPLSARH